LNSLGDATERALRLDERISVQVSNIPLPSPKQLTTEIRAYLFERAKTMQVENKIFGQLRTDKDRNGDHLIVLGPTTDKGLTAEHFVFDSGSRLSFSITVREEGKKSLLLAYRFHYQLPDGAMPAFLRFDLINRAHERASMSRAATCLLGLTKFGFQCPLSRPLRSLTGSSSLSSWIPQDWSRPLCISNRDGVHVAADGSLRPHAGALSDGYVSDHQCRLIDVGGSGKLGPCAAISTNHAVNF